MEYLDIINEDGSPTGETAPRKKAHQNGLWHLCIHVWIVNSKGEILIQKRSMEKLTWPGLWDLSVAGHVIAGENAINTAITECHEEIGIKIEEKQLKFLFDIKYNEELHDGKFRRREFIKVFLVNLDIKIDKLKLQEEEVDEVKLIHYKDLEREVKINADKFIPREQEHTSLFKLLHERYD